LRRVCDRHARRARTARVAVDALRAIVYRRRSLDVDVGGARVRDARIALSRCDGGDGGGDAAAAAHAPSPEQRAIVAGVMTEFIVAPEYLARVNGDSAAGRARHYLGECTRGATLVVDASGAPRAHSPSGGGDGGVAEAAAAFAAEVETALPGRCVDAHARVSRRIGCFLPACSRRRVVCRGVGCD
jgi:hypothetical protein